MQQQSYLLYWIRSPYSNAVFLIALFTLTYNTAKERVKRRGRGAGWAARQAQDERHLGKLKLPVVARWLWPPLPHGAAVAGGREHISASRSRTGRARTTSWPSVRARVGQAEPTTTITCPARWATCAMRARVDYAYVPEARKGMPWLALMLINVSVCRSLCFLPAQLLR